MLLIKIKKKFIIRNKIIKINSINNNKINMINAINLVIKI